MHQSLTLYHHLSQSRWPKSYLSKFMLIAFIGVHVPLLSLLIYTVLATSSWSMALPLLLVSLVATLAGSLITMFIQRHLLAPIMQTSQALHDYCQEGLMPQLPVQFSDEAGRLMANAQHCVTELDQLIKLKSDIMTIIAHDLRSPIMTIMLANEMMATTLERMNVDVAPVKKYADRIQIAANSQLALVNNTLNLMLSESGKITVQPSEIELHRLLQQVFTETKLQADHKGVCYQLASTVDPVINIRTDIPKTRQILDNLVNNAIKFTPVGGTVELGATCHERTVEFYVKDSGLGIDTAKLEHLFEPFSRDHRLGTAQEYGFGLGLWICKTFTEAQGGTLTVHSQPGQGSCFTVDLPLALADGSG